MGKIGLGLQGVIRVTDSIPTGEGKRREIRRRKGEEVRLVGANGRCRRSRNIVLS